MLTDDAGNVTDTFIYDALGNLVSHTGTSPTRYRWKGRYGVSTDGTTKRLFWLYAEYDPSLGIFVNGWMAEPLRFPSGNLAEQTGFHVNQADIELKAEKKLPCVEPSNEGCNCFGEQCEFEISARFDAGDPEGNRICFSQTPGEPLPPPANQPNPRDCRSEINRTTGGKDHFTLILRDGTRCVFNDQVMPPNAPFPPDWTKLPDNCRDAISMPPDSPFPPGQGGCYTISDRVKAIEIDFTIEIYCGCELYRTRDTIHLVGKL